VDDTMLDNQHDSIVSWVLLQTDNLEAVNRCFRLNRRMRPFGGDRTLMLRWIERHRGSEAAFRHAMRLGNIGFAIEMVSLMDHGSRFHMLEEVLRQGIAPLVVPLVARLRDDPAWDINVQLPGAGERLLHLASNAGTAQALLALEGVDVNATDYAMRTALHKAAYAGLADVVAMLLTVPGILPNRVDMLGRTALHYAVSADVVRALAAAPGIDVNIADVQARTPLHIAVIDCEDASILEVLLGTRGINVNARDSTGHTALWYAVYQVVRDSVPLDGVHALLAAPGIDANIANIRGHSPLYIAMEESRGDVRDMLLAAPGIDPNMGTNTGHIP